MKTVTNKTRAPIKVPLPRGKSLHLGPGNSGQIRDDASEHPALKKLVEEGKIEVLGVGEHGSDLATESAAPHQASQTRGKAMFRQRKGDR